MSYAFIYPQIVHLPTDYQCDITLPVSELAARLYPGRHQISVVAQVFGNGSLTEMLSWLLVFEDRKLVSSRHIPQISIPAVSDTEGRSRYMELQIRSHDDSFIFRSRRPLSNYAVFHARGRKSFFSDNAYKFGSMPVVLQVEAVGQWCEGYPVVHIDRKRNYGESLALINPYNRPLLASIISQDGRSLPRIRVESCNVELVRLDRLLQPDEEQWMGQLQLTASNRAVVFSIKRNLDEPRVILDHEHLDPYRVDPTHISAFQWLRLEYGRRRRDGFLS